MSYFKLNLIVIFIINILQICYCDNLYFETFYDGNTEMQSINRNAIKYESYKWPNRTIPFYFDDSLMKSERFRILQAISLIQQRTCIKFVQKPCDCNYWNNDHYQTYVKFIKTGACGAPVGYRQNKTEPINVMYTPYCLSSIGAIQHELLHVIGLFHEQSRPDRDEYITIVWDNIMTEYKKNFARGEFEYIDTFDLPYDYASLMHYPNNAFAINSNTYTIYAKNGSAIKLGQSDGPTFYDLEKIRLMYGCGK